MGMGELTGTMDRLGGFANTEDPGAGGGGGGVGPGVTGSRTDGIRLPCSGIKSGITGSSLLNSGNGDRTTGPDDVSFKCTGLKCAVLLCCGCIGGVASEPELARGRGAIAIVLGCFGLSSFGAFLASSFSLTGFGLVSAPSLTSPLLGFGLESADSLLALALTSCRSFSALSTLVRSPGGPGKLAVEFLHGRQAAYL